MKQILQNLQTGETEVVNVPAPEVAAGHLLIRTSYSLISAGTERMLVEFGKGNVLQKARQQPDKVKQVLEKIRTDGIMPTLNSVRNKLSQPLALGYANAGEVLAIGAGVSGFAPGDRVASNGNHAEMALVPSMLCAKIPPTVNDETAAYTVLASIALQGIRLAGPALGETIVVIGLGLIGLLTVQLLRAQGCRVIASDLNSERLTLADHFGAHAVNPNEAEGADGIVPTVESLTRGQGADAVIIAASTKSSDPVRQAARACRKRGRIVLVGVAGLELSRADFYEKELTFQVSCSYGPGRYDPLYEEKGQDYPIGFVRWTEQRNFQAVLEIMAEKKLNTEALTTHHFPISHAGEAYKLINSGEPSLGIVLEYPRAPEQAEQPEQPEQHTALAPNGQSPAPRNGGKQGKRVAFVGAGNYAGAVLIPAFKAGGAELAAVVSQKGVSAFHAARKHGFERAVSTADELLQNADIQAVVIATRHNDHAELVERALRAGKHVFVEKPLCLQAHELSNIQKLYKAARENGSPPVLMVGFNRRFSPLVQKMKMLLDKMPQAKSFIMTVNAGSIPADHWTQDREVGGGRIIGEACHFIDLLRFLAGSAISNWKKNTMMEQEDTVSIDLGFEDGSVGSIHYFANGSRSFPKERLEVFSGGAILQLNNFRRLTGYGWPRFSRMNLMNQNKGQLACARAFVESISHGAPPPIPPEELFEVSRVAIELAH